MPARAGVWWRILKPPHVSMPGRASVGRRILNLLTTLCLRAPV